MGKVSVGAVQLFPLKLRDFNISPQLCLWQPGHTWSKLTRTPPDQNCCSSPSWWHALQLGQKRGSSAVKGAAALSTKRRKKCLPRRRRKQQRTLLPRWHHISHQPAVPLSLRTCRQAAKTQRWALSSHWLMLKSRSTRQIPYFMSAPTSPYQSYRQTARERYLIAAHVIKRTCLGEKSREQTRAIFFFSLMVWDAGGQFSFLFSWRDCHRSQRNNALISHYSKSAFKLGCASEVNLSCRIHTETEFLNSHRYLQLFLTRSRWSYCTEIQN